MERSEIIKICEGLEIDLQSFENYLDSIYSQDISRDMIYDYAGANMFVNRYLLKYSGKIFELPYLLFSILF